MGRLGLEPVMFCTSQTHDALRMLLFTFVKKGTRKYNFISICIWRITEFPCNWEYSPQYSRVIPGETPNRFLKSLSLGLTRLMSGFC